MNLKILQRLNPDYSIKSINDESFQTFGKIIDEDVSDVIAYVSTNVHPPKFGNRYQPSVPAVEQFSSVQKISQKVYGYMEVMAGVVSGHNHVFTGIEYH